MFKQVNGLKKEKLEKFHLRETKSVSSILENARMERRRVVLLAYVEFLAAYFKKKVTITKTFLFLRLPRDDMVC